MPGYSARGKCRIMPTARRRYPICFKVMRLLLLFATYFSHQLTSTKIAIRPYGSVQYVCVCVARLAVLLIWAVPIQLNCKHTQQDGKFLLCVAIIRWMPAEVEFSHSLFLSVQHPHYSLSISTVFIVFGAGFFFYWRCFSSCQLIWV